MNKNNSDAAQNIINKLPQSVRAALYTDIAVDGVTITAQDQSDMLAVMADIDAKAQESRLKAFDKLPDSVHGLINLRSIWTRSCRSDCSLWGCML